ncbi:MAG: hypothetical protein DMF00_14000 [Verrucomicrobia bacterium]|nr:MAG: hypothetical protein DMF00_14000 [Verrucomicrobiota bacterium]
MHNRRLPEANQDCEARFSARDGALGVHRISSACPAAESYLIRVEAMAHIEEDAHHAVIPMLKCAQSPMSRSGKCMRKAALG